MEFQDPFSSLSEALFNSVLLRPNAKGNSHQESQSIAKNTRSDPGDHHLHSVCKIITSSHIALLFVPGMHGSNVRPAVFN